jgi:hypothetical protein
MLEIEYGPERYAVEYQLKGENKWRRTMEHPYDTLALQEQVLRQNPTVSVVRSVALREELRVIKIKTEIKRGK